MQTFKDPDELLTAQQLAAEGFGSASTLAKKRLSGDGPPYFKIGHQVRYRRREAYAWLESRLRRSTSQAA